MILPELHKDVLKTDYGNNSWYRVSGLSAAQWVELYPTTMPIRMRTERTFVKVTHESVDLSALDGVYRVHRKIVEIVDEVTSVARSVANLLDSYERSIDKGAVYAKLRESNKLKPKGKQK